MSIDWRSRVAPSTEGAALPFDFFPNPPAANPPGFADFPSFRLAAAATANKAGVFLRIIVANFPFNLASKLFSFKILCCAKLLVENAKLDTTCRVKMLSAQIVGSITKKQGADLLKWSCRRTRYARANQNSDKLQRREPPGRGCRGRGSCVSSTKLSPESLAMSRCLYW